MAPGHFLRVFRRVRTDAFEAVHGDEAKAWADAYVIGISALADFSIEEMDFFHYYSVVPFRKIYEDIVYL